MANLQNMTVSDTGSLTLPTGTHSNRGTINTTVTSFTTVTSTTWTVPANVTSVEVLVVGGGGGGGRYGGGGGAGGVIYNPNYVVTPGQVITVTVGAGGAGHPGDAQSGGTASSGGTSRFGDLVAYGGGGGGNYNQGGATTANAGAAGGSGGGSGTNGNDARRQLVFLPGGAGTPGQGNNGGAQGAGYATGGGGGGGAGEGGKNGTATAPFGGAGGNGILSTISGTATWYGGGGGGCAGNGGSAYSGTVPGGLGGGGTGLNPGNNSSSADGVANTGGGGGGTCDSTISGTARAGNGGSGVVIVRYALTSDNQLPTAQMRWNSNTKTFENYKGNNQWDQKKTGENIVTNGLRFHMDPKYYSGSGTTVYDLSGFDYHATLNGSITYSAAGGYFDFGSTGHSSYISVPSATINGATEYTVSMWLYLNAYNSSIDTFFTCGPGNDVLYFYSGRNVVNHQNTAGVDIPFPNVKGEWIHFTATSKGGVVKLYRNGINTGSGAQSSTVNVTSTLGIVLGQEMDSTSGSFETIQSWLGRFGPVQLYNRALEDGEVRRNYEAYRSRYQTYAPMIYTHSGMPGSSPDTAAPSARWLREQAGVTKNGFYWIKPGNLDPIWVYCDMKYNNGGWVLVAANCKNGAITGAGGSNGIGNLTWYQSVNHVWYNGNVDYGNPGNTDFNTAGTRLRFRAWIGLKYWQALGYNIAQFAAADAYTLSQTSNHTKRYRWAYTGLGATYGFQGASAVGDDGSGAGAPGMYSYHAANGYAWTTADNDLDAASNNCASNYGNTPWWYGACWSGNMWGGGNSGSYQDGPFWDGSGSDYHNYMAVYLKV